LISKSRVNLLRLVPSASLAALAFAGLSLHIPRQFDLHHTGLLATKLIAAGDSYAMHSEVFSQYGPLLTWSQVPFLWLGYSPVVTLHIWAALVTALTVFLIADVGRVAPQNWKVSQSVSTMAAAVWFVLDPTLRTGYLNAWSSLLVAFLFCAALYLLAIGMRRLEVTGSTAFVTASLVLAGVLIGLSPFARINAGLAGVVVLIIAASIFATLNRMDGRWIFPRLIGGILIGVTIPIVILLTTASMSDYWSQGVVGPLLWAQSAIEPTYWNTWSGLLDRFLSVSNRIIPLFLLMIVGFGAASHFLSRGLRKPYLASLAVAMAALFAFFGYLAGFIDLALRALRDSELNLAAEYQSISEDLYRNGLYFLVFAYSILSVFQLVRIVLSAMKTSGKTGTDAFFDLVLWGLGLALLIQVIPTYDNRHAWWALPLAILSVVRFTDHVAPNRWSSRVFGLSLFLLFVLPMLGASSQELARTLHPAPVGSFAAGASTETDMVREAEYQLEVAKIISSKPSYSPTYYMVRDGSVAAIDGIYRSAFPEFVWWASKPNIVEINDVPWSALVIDSWTAGFLGFENMEELILWFGAESECVGERAQTIYCVVSR